MARTKRRPDGPAPTRERAPRKRARASGDGRPRSEKRAKRSSGSERDSKGSKRRGASRRVKRQMRRLSDSFQELRYEAASSRRDVVGVLTLSFGSLSLGAGIYAQFMWRDATATPGYAPLLLAAGVVLLAIYTFYAPSRPEVLVVGELGVGFEHDGRVTRTAWYQIQKLTFSDEKLSEPALVLKTSGTPVLVPVKAHPAAARRIVEEARARIADRVDMTTADEARFGSAADTGQLQPVDPPQVTDMTCRATDRPLSVEKDVRMCGVCGVFYHQSGVPSRCLECGAPLRG